MCCEPRAGHGGCCCSHHGGFARHFITRAERVEALKSYRDELQKELEGLSEHIDELEKQ